MASLYLAFRKSDDVPGSVLGANGNRCPGCMTLANSFLLGTPVKHPSVPGCANTQCHLRHLEKPGLLEGWHGIPLLIVLMNPAFSHSLRH